MTLNCGQHVMLVAYIAYDIKHGPWCEGLSGWSGHPMGSNGNYLGYLDQLWALGKSCSRAGCGGLYGRSGSSMCGILDQLDLGMLI